MFKKVHFKTAILLSSMLAAVAMAQVGGGLVYHEAQIKDELGRRVTDITTVTIYGPGTTSAQTIYKDSARSLAITQPLTTSSTNTTLVDGQFFWYGPDGWDYTIGDGTNTHTNNGHNSLNASDALIIFPSYLQSISSTTYTDAQSATFGSDGDWVLRGGAVAEQMSFTPGSDNSTFIIGTNGTALNSSFDVYVGVDLGLKLDSSVPSLTWDGGAVTLNHDSNFNVGLATGTSTGAISIGNSAAGIITLDSTTTLTINSDGAMGITTTDGSADLTVDATLGSIIIDGGEAVADAVIIRATGAAGGIDIASLADIDITTTGTAGEDISLTNTGGSINLSATEAIADAVTIAASAGGVDISAAATFDIDITATGGKILMSATENAAGSISMTVNGGVSETIVMTNTQGTGTGAITLTTTAAGDLDFNSGDDITIDAVDDMATTVGGDYTLAVTGTTTLPNDVLRKVSVAISDAEMDNLAGTQITLVPGVAGNTIEFVSAVFGLDWGSTAWTEPSAPDDLVIRYTNGTGAIVSQLLDATGFATATEDTFAYLGPIVSDAAGATIASVAVTETASTNKALVLDNTGDEWTNSGNSQVVVIVYYRLHTTAELGL